MSQEQDKIFFRNYLIVLGILAAMIIIFIIAARAIGLDEENMAEKRADEVSAVTQPVGQVRTESDAAAESEAAPAAAPEVASTVAESGPEDVGKRVFSGLCFSCHASGLPGIPQFGDKAAWADRIKKGKDTLYNHALHGFTGTSGIAMPAKGGNPALSDDEVKAAVDYIVANSE